MMILVSLSIFNICFGCKAHFFDNCRTLNILQTLRQIMGMNIKNCGWVYKYMYGENSIMCVIVIVILGNFFAMMKKFFWNHPHFTSSLSVRLRVFLPLIYTLIILCHPARFGSPPQIGLFRRCSSE